MTFSPRSIDIYSTCPQSRDVEQGQYLRRAIETARWSERYGCRGMLIYSDNGLVDPWLVAGAVLQQTRELRPLIAVQPIYMHPYEAAKLIATYGYLYGRQVSLNMIAGGFKNDLIALNDNTPHDDRYVRLVEYTTIVQRLLETEEPVTFEGKYYTVTNLKLTPQLAPSLRPGVLVSGSSEAGLAAAHELNAVPIKYPQRAPDEPAQEPVNGVSPGIRVGIIARETSEEAWQIAHRRFPADRKGQLAHQLAMKVSDSQWHRQLSEMADEDAERDDPYWLGPFQNYKTFCPYLVGSYDVVGEQLGRYIDLGYRTFVLDIPPSEEELEQTWIAFDFARRATAGTVHGGRLVPGQQD